MSIKEIQIKWFSMNTLRKVYMLSFMCIFILYNAVASSQDSIKYTIRYPEVMKLKSPIFVSTNAATLSTIPKLEFGTLSIDYKHANGEFKPVLLANSSDAVSLFTEKYIFLKNTVLYGSFTGTKKWDKSVDYSNVDNPYRDTPYLMLDTVGNDNYDRECYEFSSAIASTFGKSTFGASLKYKVGLTAQSRDPRAKNLVTQFDISPGYLISFNKLKLGANVGFNYYNEEINVSIVEQNRVDNMYYLLGLRAATTVRDNSFLRLYKRYAYQAEIQATHSWFTFIAGAKMFNESVDDGQYNWAQKKQFSRLNGTNGHVKAMATVSSEALVHQVTLNANTQYSKGTEIIQKQEVQPPYGQLVWVTLAENETYSQLFQNVGLAYSLTKMQSDFIRDYAFGLSATYKKEVEKYRVLNDESSYGNLDFSVHFYKMFDWGKYMVSFQPMVNYRYNLQNKLQITDYSQYPDITLPAYYSVLENKIVRPDFQYVTTNYFSPELGVTCEKALLNSKNKIFVKGSFRWILPENNLKGQRQLLSGTVGVTL